jgi:lipoprotein LprG
MVSRRSLAPLAVVTAMLLTGCSGSNGSTAEEPSPAEVLAQAKQLLDDTPGVRLRLETPKLPQEVSGVVKADGIATHQPAFEGTIDLLYSGFTGTVPVTAVDGGVCAVLPFTEEFVDVDPGEYGAPDPAALMDPDAGVSAWLTATTDLEEGAQVRDGADVLSTFDGTLGGRAVASAIPSADGSADFDASFSIDDEGRLRTASVTGPFYKGKPELTYDVTFTEYGTEKDIQPTC